MLIFNYSIMIIESFWIFKMFFIQYCENSFWFQTECHVVPVSCDSRFHLLRITNQIGLYKWVLRVSRPVYYILFYRIRCEQLQTMNNSIRYSKPAIFDILNLSLNSTRKDLISRLKKSGQMLRESSRNAKCVTQRKL